MEIFIFIIFMIWCIPGSYLVIWFVKFLMEDTDTSSLVAFLVVAYITFTAVFIISLIRWDILNLGQ
jgi:hypothetical protein